MKYRIIGADRDTGDDVELVIDAASEVAARQQAARRGMLVASIEASNAGVIATALPYEPLPTAGATREPWSIQRIVFAVVCALGMLGTFLPWVTGPLFGSINGTRGDGWITFGLFAASLAVGLFVRKPMLTGVTRFIAPTPAAIAGGIGIVKIVNFQNMMSDNAATAPNAFASAMMSTFQVGAGLYLIVAAGIAAVVVVFAVRR